MSEQPGHDRRAIGAFLISAFNHEELTELFYYAENPALRDVLHQFPPGESLPAWVQKAVSYCERHDLLDQLLAEIEQARPDQFRDWPHRRAGPQVTFSSPSQAPRPLAEFVGRTDELKHLEESLKPGTKTAITGLVGMGGLGKTELAKLAASRVGHCFRDGVLWADCGKQDVGAIADQWAAACGVQLTGEDLTSKAAAWRGLISVKEALLIFDNLQPEQNLDPLFPSSGRSAVLITTRDAQHQTLLGAELLQLDQFSLIEALALTGKVLGQDTAEGQEVEAERLFELVGYLPLAVNVSLQLAREHNYRLAHLNKTLEAAGALKVLGERERLEKSLNATFRTAWGNLGDLQETFRTLSVFNQGPTFSTQALADTLGLDTGESGTLLHRLAGRSLLTEETTGRWSLHSLLREFVGTLEPPDDGAHLRMARHYEQVARDANRLYVQGGDNTLQALARFDLEWPHIQAGQAWVAAHANDHDDIARLCSDYPDAAQDLLLLRLTPRERIAWLVPALLAARHLRDKRAESSLLGSLGSAYYDAGECDRAIQYYEQALEVYDQVGYIDGKAAIYNNLATVYGRERKWDRCIEYLVQSLAVKYLVGDVHGMARTYSNLGLVRAAEGDSERAIELFEQALVTFEQVGDIYSMASTYGNLAVVYAEKGSWNRVMELHNQALRIFRELGVRQDEAKALSNIGISYCELGDTVRARQYLTQALAIFEAIDTLQADRVRQWLITLKD